MAAGYCRVCSCFLNLSKVISILKGKRPGVDHVYTPIVICRHQPTGPMHTHDTSKQKEPTRCCFTVKPASLSAEQTLAYIYTVCQSSFLPTPDS